MRDGFRVYLREFLAGFDGYLLYGIVIEFSFDADIFEARYFIGNQFFPFDVAFVFDADFGGFGYFFPPRRNEVELFVQSGEPRGYGVYGELRAQNQIDEFRPLPQGGVADSSLRNILGRNG